jgi:hypothetical protein
MNGLTPQVIAIKNAVQSCFPACLVLRMSPDFCHEEFPCHGPVVASTTTTASATSASSASASSAVAKEAFLPSLMPSSQMAAPALAVVTPVRVNVALVSATFSWSWWFAIDRVSGCVVSLERARCLLSRRTLGRFLLSGLLLVVSHIEHRLCLRSDNPSTLVFVEETNRLSEQSVEISSWIISAFSCSHSYERMSEMKSSCSTILSSNLKALGPSKTSSPRPMRRPVIRHQSWTYWLMLAPGNSRSLNLYRA